MVEMNVWSIVGIASIIAFLLAWSAASIKLRFFPGTKTAQTATDLDDYDENHPEDFDLVRKYSKKTTWLLVGLSIAITIGGIGFTTYIVATKCSGLEDYFASVGMVMAAAFPLALLWVANLVFLTKMQRKEGTSPILHSSKEQ